MFLFVFQKSLDALSVFHNRRKGNGEYEKIAWFEHDEKDYVLMDYVIDTDGQKVALVSL